MSKQHKISMVACAGEKWLCDLDALTVREGEAWPYMAWHCEIKAKSEGWPAGLCGSISK